MKLGVTQFVMKLHQTLAPDQKGSDIRFFSIFAHLAKGLIVHRIDWPIPKMQIQVRFLAKLRK